jgi:4-amino-4-deoxychorismate lyase
MWLVNGEVDADLPPADRGLAYGDGLFETLALRDGQWRFLDYHLERLQDGCQRLAIPAPDEQLLRAELETARGQVQHGTGKIIVTRGVGPRGYRPPVDPTPSRILSVSAAATPSSAAPGWAAGIRLRVCRTPMSENAALAGMKTLNRLDQVLARAEWKSADYAEGLMLTADGLVICGTMSNVFFVDQGTLLTPALDRCGIRGVMRRVVLEEAVKLGIEFSERPVPIEAARTADELFVCNSLHGIGPVIALEGQDRRPAALTRQLMSALSARGVMECGA